jgi:hypothetical protein
MWMNHHRTFTHIEGSNDTPLVLKLLLLLGVTAVPFPTVVPGRASGDSGTADRRTSIKGGLVRRQNQHVLNVALAMFFALPPSMMDMGFAIIFSLVRSPGMVGLLYPVLVHRPGCLF